MEIQTRHRIIGIAVIIALILIFVPLLVSKRLNQPQMVAPGIPTPPPAPQVQNPTGVTNSTDQTTISPATSGADQMPLVTSASGINQTQPVTSVSGIDQTQPVTLVSGMDQTQIATTPGNSQIPAVTTTPIKQCSPEDGNCDVNIPSSDADSQSMDDNSQPSDQSGMSDQDQDATLPTDQSSTLNGTSNNVPVVQQPSSNADNQTMNNNPQPSDQSGMGVQGQNAATPMDQSSTLNGTNDNVPVAQQPSLQTAPVTSESTAVKPVKLQEDNTAEKMTYAVLGKKTVAKTKTVMHKQPIAHTKVNTVGWVVQIGYFSSEKNANHIIQQLQKKGFTAFGYKAKAANGGTGVHVYIGPSVDYAKAKSVQTRLAKDMNIKGYVTQFDASAMN